MTTVTTENEGGLLSRSYRWKYVVSPGKLMTEPGNESLIQFWMSIPPPGESWGCRAEPCLFLAQEVRAVTACCPQFWPFRHALGDISKTCAHPMVPLFCVRSGRIPQPLQVLMFALLRPLPKHPAVTLWRLWNNLKLVSRDFANTSLLGLVFKSKIQEVNSSLTLIFCMQNFSSVFSAFPTGAA